MLGRKYQIPVHKLEQWYVREIKDNIETCVIVHNMMAEEIGRTKKTKTIIIWILQWNTYNGKRQRLICIVSYRRSFMMVLQSMWLVITTSMNDICLT